MKITDDMLNRAIKKAFEIGILPVGYDDRESMLKILQSSLKETMTPMTLQEIEKAAEKGREGMTSEDFIVLTERWREVKEEYKDYPETLEKVQARIDEIKIK